MAIGQAGLIGPQVGRGRHPDRAWNLACQSKHRGRFSACAYESCAERQFLVESLKKIHGVFIKANPMKFNSNFEANAL
jgi:hypothetical protein